MAFLGGTRDLPLGRPQAGDRHFKFHETRDNLTSACITAAPSTNAHRKKRTVANTAIDRELASECWSLAVMTD